MFWVMMNDHPEYNAKVALMQGLGPVARVDHMHSVIRVFAPFANEIEVRLSRLTVGQRGCSCNGRCVERFFDRLVDSQ